MKNQENKIFVSKPFLPDFKAYSELLEQVWQSSQLTNNGEMLQRLEKELKSYLNLNNLNVVGNGTLALQLALKALNVKGKVLTTPFSFVATTSVIAWEGLEYEFVDIDPKTFNVSVESLEKRLALGDIEVLLFTHVFGNPCDVEAIDRLAKKFEVKVIYDAAHAFGVSVNGKSLFSYGDISVCSFHATKVFHTVEGGLVVCRSKELQEQVASMMNFGIDSQSKEIKLVGINAKNSEVHAAMGLAVLPHMAEIFDKRKQIFNLYHQLLGECVEFQCCDVTNFNYAYMPVLFNSEDELLNVEKALNSHGICPRRYFYPSLNKLPFVDLKQSCPISESVSTRILCLPLYPDLELSSVKFICSLIRGVI